MAEQEAITLGDLEDRLADLRQTIAAAHSIAVHDFDEVAKLEGLCALVRHANREAATVMDAITAMNGGGRA
mgnify:CR=1 FL=1